MGSHDSSYPFTLTAVEQGCPCRSGHSHVTYGEQHPFVLPGGSPCICHNKQSLLLRWLSFFLLEIRTLPLPLVDLSGLTYTTAKMRFSFAYAASAALMTSVAYSQGISDLVAQIHSCAITCLATAATSARCGLTDYACQC